jgi:hypothetical protein
MRQRRYAEGTTVAVGKTKDEIDHLLSKAGASQTVMGSDREGQRVMVGFSLGGRQYRRQASTKRRDKYSKTPNEQLEREAWRALLLIVKAKLEVVSSGYSTMEAEFLSDIVLPNGQTVSDDVLPKIEAAYNNGVMPLLLPP